jgi:hypothetical protein
MRVSTDTDSNRVKKLMESEEMRDRKPSQFYQYLRKLAIPSTPDDFILSLWRNRLPARIRRILAAIDHSNSEKLRNPDCGRIRRGSTAYSTDNNDNPPTGAERTIERNLARNFQRVKRPEEPTKGLGERVQY